MARTGRANRRRSRLWRKTEEMALDAALMKILGGGNTTHLSSVCGASVRSTRIRHDLVMIIDEHRGVMEEEYACLGSFTFLPASFIDSSTDVINIIEINIGTERLQH
ncbi:hypothetical protein Dimus_008192 [Dionaea muscipula]